MRMTRYAPLAFAAFLSLADSTAFAQKPKIKIEKASLGLPPGRFAVEKDSTTQQSLHIVKRNVWAPIYVQLKMLGEYDGKAKLKIESADADELRTTMVIPLNTTFGDRLPGTMVEPTELGIVPNVRSGDREGTITLTVISDPPEGRPKDLSEPYKIRYPQFSNVSDYVIVSLGSRLPGFDLPKDNVSVSNGSSRGGLRNGRVQTSTFTNVRELPDQWFAYGAADLVVLATGSAPAEFLDELFDDDKSRPFADRREALFEWVRRGGKLIISAGSNASKVSQYEKLREVLPATFNRDQPSKGVKGLLLEWKINNVGYNANLVPRTETFPMGRLTANPARAPRYMIPTAEEVSEPLKPPAVVQAPFGLGRVTLVAFDLDQSPFIDSAKRAEFWDWLIREAGSQRAAIPGTTTNNNMYNSYGNYTDTEDEYATSLRTHVDTFDGVPVISFGWVALFIVLYTLVIGPVEYIILKKVFGRLELTWITFPIIVISVSAAAYFTAYAIKGNDLKVNKVDVIDIDVQGNRAYGRTWFTVFSPRIDSYTIGVEPREGWALPNAPNGPVPQVGWMAGGRGSGGSGIVTRGYTYHTENNARVQADGLEKVPIQVWSTKAFSGSWSAYTDKVTPPIDADIYHPAGKPNDFAGSFVNNLPVKALNKPVLFYAGVAYELPTLTPGQKVTVNSSLPIAKGWLDSNAGLSSVAVTNYNTYNSPYSSSSKANVQTVSTLSLWGLLFHERAVAKSSNLMNGSLRDLDMSWRISEDNRQEAVLVAKIYSTTGLAEELMDAKDGPSVTKLWLKNLPTDKDAKGDQAARQPVPGTLRQETYIRVYIPVQAKPKAAK